MIGIQQRSGVAPIFHHHLSLEAPSGNASGKNIQQPLLRSPTGSRYLNHIHSFDEVTAKSVHQNRNGRLQKSQHLDAFQLLCLGDQLPPVARLNNASERQQRHIHTPCPSTHKRRGALRKMLAALFHTHHQSLQKTMKNLESVNQSSIRVHPGTNQSQLTLMGLIETIGKRVCKTQTGMNNSTIIGKNGNHYVLLNSLTPKQVDQLETLLNSCEPEVEEMHQGRLKVIIGSGAFGNVRIALNKTTGQLAVVKKMLPHYGLEEIKKFEMLNSLPHEARKSVVNLEDYAIVPGKNGKLKAYLFEEFMTNGDLGDYENAAILNFPSSLAEKLDLALHILELVQTLHDNHTYHRDIKPDNLLRAQDGSLKLGDVGFMCQELYPDEPGGTIPFMPPEANQVNARADLADAFAIGVMFYQMLGKIHPTADYPNPNIKASLGSQAFEFNTANNGYLKEHASFLKDCDLSALKNQTQQFDLSSVALQMMHPVPEKRLTVPDAKKLLTQLYSKAILKTG